MSANGRTSEPDTIRVTVSGTTNNAPVAVAGLDYTLPFGSNFFLDGTSSSDADGDSLSFLWEVVEAPDSVAIEDSSAAQTRFTPVSIGSFLFRLTVDDGLTTHADEGAIVVTGAGNLPPHRRGGCAADSGCRP